MSHGHFFKHLSYTLSLGLLHRSFSKFKPNSPFHCKPISSLLSNIIPLASYSSPPSSASTSTHYLSVRIHCPKHVSDMLSDALLCFGANSASIEQDDNDSSDKICIESIFFESQDVDLCVSQAADSIGLKKIPNYEVKKGKECDWVLKTQESFHPVEVTEGLWIVPEWRSPPNEGAKNIILNPGLAFGTGEHPTTKLCLLLLQDLIKGGELLLDYGTGSGILAIAALKFGGALSVGFDIDPQAISSARHNAALNNIEPEAMKLLLVPNETSPSLLDEGSEQFIKEQSPDKIGLISETEKYDVVIANILLNPLLELADHIVSYAKPGATVGLSGILSEQVHYIIDRYSALLEDTSVAEIDDWVCVSGRKKRNSHTS